MFAILEIDRRWAGIGVDWFRKVKGIRLGYIALHFVAGTFNVNEFIRFRQWAKKGGTGLNV